MAYIVQSDLEGKIPPALIDQALDDDGDGAADAGAWDKLIADVTQEIDGILGQRFAVPFTTPYPALVIVASKVLAAEAMYKKRGMAKDANPWSDDAKQIRAKLSAIGSGKESFEPSRNGANPPVVVIGETSRIYSENAMV
jgi:phage gp36-like protein